MEAAFQSVLLSCKLRKQELQSISVDQGAEGEIFLLLQRRLGGNADKTRNRRSSGGGVESFE